MHDFLDFGNLSKNTISHDGIDRMVSEGILQQSPDLRMIRNSGTEVLKTFSHLQEDVFYSLYKPFPQLIKKERISPDYYFNHQEMEKLLEAPAYQELKQYTQLDEFGAGLGSKALLEELLNRLKEDSSLQEAAELVNQANQAQQKAEELQKSLEDMPGGGKSGSRQLKQELQKSLEEAQDFAAKAEQQMANSQSQMRRAVTAAAEKAAGECEETEAILTSWGFHKGQFQRLPFEQKMELVNVLRGQKKFKDMAKVVGRMRNLALASRKAKLDQPRIELHSITTGDDITRALTQELVSLRKKELKLNFYRKLYEKQLLQYDLSHRDKAGQGPIVCLIDSSGSMSGLRDEWAKAVALGLLEISIKERRAFAYAVFGSSSDPLYTDTFLSGDHSPEKVMNMVTSFYGGGTNFEKPLRWAMEAINQSAFKKADVVMITDGECQVDEEFLREFLVAKENKEFSVYSILIGSSSYELERWSDEIYCVNDLLDDSVPENLFRNI